MQQGAQQNIRAGAAVVSVSAGVCSRAALHTGVAQVQGVIIGFPPTQRKG